MRRTPLFFIPFLFLFIPFLFLFYFSLEKSEIVPCHKDASTNLKIVSSKFSQNVAKISLENSEDFNSSFTTSRSSISDTINKSEEKQTVEKIESEMTNNEIDDDALDTEQNTLFESLPSSDFKQVVRV